MVRDIRFGLDGRECTGREADRMKEASTYDIQYGSESSIGTSATFDATDGLSDIGKPTY